MNPKSASTCVWLSVILIVIGAVAGNPAFQFSAFAMAGLSAAFPSFLGRKRVRILGWVFFILAMIVAFASYPACDHHMKNYRKSASHTL